MSTITTMPVSMEGWQEEQQSWNQTSKFFVNMHKREDRVAQVVDFVARLQELGIHPAEGETALDVGCGTGDYAMGLARNGVKVTGVDLSTGMLEGGKAISEREGLSLDLWLGPWSEEARQALGWDKKFDLVYSIFCPIMSDTANLHTLHRASRKDCLCIMFADRKDEYLDAIDYFCIRVQRKVGGNLDDIKEEIREFLSTKAVDGKLENHTTDTIAWISWSV